MSRCPPPLGPMCWGGKSSTCRASSPTVSVLPRQESPCPERHERGVKQGAGLAGPGEHAGGRMGYPASEPAWEWGWGRWGVGMGAGDQHGCGPVPLPGQPAVSGRADGCPREGCPAQRFPSSLSPRAVPGSEGGGGFPLFPS